MKYAITPLLALACCAAQAQSAVKIYGVADAGLVFERGGPAGGTSYVSSGVASGSRLGFKGTEDLGGGMSAGFVLESGISIDSGASGQGGLTFGRQSFVSLGGALGTLSAGRQYSPYFKALRDIADPFGDGLAGQAANLMVPNRRMDNSVVYASPKLAGWSTDLAYSAGEVAGDSSRKRALSGAVNFAAGPLALALSHYRREDAAASLHARNTLLAARYTLGAYQLHAAYAVNRGMGTVGGGGTLAFSAGGAGAAIGTLAAAGGSIAAGPVGAPGAASRDMVLGLCATFGPHRYAASVVQHMDRSPANKDARQFGLGYLYGLSKRTDLYAAYGRVNNSNGATFTIGNATDDGKGRSAVNLGLRHLL
jgi:predicted porin